MEYGNREFIETGENGIRFERTPLKDMPEQLAKAIISFYEQQLDKKGRMVSKQKAKAYLKANVAKRWQDLLEKRNGLNEN